MPATDPAASDDGESSTVAAGAASTKARTDSPVPAGARDETDGKAGLETKASEWPARAAIMAAIRAIADEQTTALRNLADRRHAAEATEREKQPERPARAVAGGGGIRAP